jgi:predicted Abi (CAAX) family protease
VLFDFPLINHRFQFDRDQPEPSLMHQIVENLEVIMAQTRVGRGLGVTVVDASSSCDQDSNLAVYNFFKQFQVSVVNNAQVQAWLRAHPASEDAMMYKEFVQFKSQFTKAFLLLARYRRDWQRQAWDMPKNEGEADDMDGWGRRHMHAPSLAKKVWFALLTVRFLVPRWTFDELTLFFYRHGSNVRIHDYHEIGGAYDPGDVMPLAPGIDPKTCGYRCLTKLTSCCY